MAEEFNEEQIEENKKAFEEEMFLPDEEKQSCIAVLKSNKNKQIFATVTFSFITAAMLFCVGGAIALNQWLACLYLPTPTLLAVEETVRHGKNTKILTDMINKVKNDDYAGIFEKYDNSPNRFVTRATEFVKDKLITAKDEKVFEDFNL